MRLEKKTKEMWNQVLDQDLTEPFPNLPPPWKKVNNVHFIETNVTKKQNKDEQRTQAEKVIKERNWTEIYTDGSAKDANTSWSWNCHPKEQRNTKEALIPRWPLDIIIPSRNPSNGQSNRSSSPNGRKPSRHYHRLWNRSFKEYRH